jgi:hypothetical protein
VHRLPPKLTDQQSRVIAHAARYDVNVLSKSTHLDEASEAVATASPPAKRSRWQMPRWLERSVTWLCLLVFLALAMGLTYVPIRGIVYGELSAWSRSETSRLVQFAVDPGPFLLHLFSWSFAAMAFWWMFRIAWKQTTAQR